MVREQWLLDELVYCHCPSATAAGFQLVCFLFLLEPLSRQTSGLQNMKGCDEMSCWLHLFIRCTGCILTMAKLDL